MGHRDSFRKGFWYSAQFKSAGDFTEVIMVLQGHEWGQNQSSKLQRISTLFDLPYLPGTVFLMCFVLCKHGNARLKR